MGLTPHAGFSEDRTTEQTGNQLDGVSKLDGREAAVLILRIAVAPGEALGQWGLVRGGGSRARTELPQRLMRLARC